MSEEDKFRERIKDAVERHGSLRAVARIFRVDVAYLSRLRTSVRYNPSDRLLKKLGLKRVVTYEEKDG